MTVRDQSARGSVVVTAMTTTLQLLRIVSTILLARILEPEHFGVMAMANLVIMGLGIFAGLGLSQALIATKDNVGDAAWQVLLLTLTTGTTFAVAMYGGSHVIAAFFEAPELVEVAQVLSIVVLCQAVKIVPDALLVKEMKFGRRVLPNILASLTGITVSLTLAYSGFGLWSLVYGALSSSIVLSLGLILAVPEWRWLVSARWHWQRAKALLRFGMHNLGTWITQYFYNNVDHLVVAKSLGSTQLGFYSQALSLSRMPVNTFSTAINSVLLPAYSQISGDYSRLRSAYLDSLRAIAVVTTPIALGLFVIAPDAIIVLIGEKWSAAIPILQAFSFMSLVRPLSGTTSPLFLSLQKPEHNFRCALIQAAFLVVMVWPGLYWGATGVAIIVVLAFCVGYAYNLYVMSRKLPVVFRVSEVLGQLVPSLVSAVIMVLAVSVSRASIVATTGPVSSLWSLSALVLIGALAYVTSLFFVDRRLLTEIFRLFSRALFKKPA